MYKQIDLVKIDLLVDFLSSYDHKQSCVTEYGLALNQCCKYSRLKLNLANIEYRISSYSLRPWIVSAAEIQFIK